MNILGNSLALEESFLNRIKKRFTRDSDFLNILLPLLDKLNWEKDLLRLAELLPHFASELTLVDFRNVLVNLGFSSTEKKCYLSKISAKKLPCLFISSAKEVLLIQKFSKQNSLQTVTVLDGKTRKEKILNLEDMVNLYGTVYYFNPIIINKFTEKKWFFSVLKKFKPIIIQIFTVHFLYNILTTSVTLFIMVIYDKVIPSNSSNMLINFMLGVIIILVSIYMISVLKSKMIAYITIKLDKIVGYVIIKHILSLPSNYTDNITLNNQIAKIKDFDNVREFFSSNVAMLFFELPLSMVFVIAIIYVSGAMIVIPLILAVLFFSLSFFAHNVVDNIVKLQNHDSILKQGLIFEAFSNLKEIKSSAMITSFVSKFEDVLQRLAKYDFKSSMVNYILMSISDLIILLSALGVLGFGTFLAMHQKLSAGALIAVMLLTWKILDPIKTFFISIPLINQVQDSINQINALINLPTETAKDNLTKISVVNSIKFKRVSFRYPGQSNATLLGVSFNVAPNKITCITGKSGSGKSTIIKLILAMNYIQAGNIIINDTNIIQLQPISLRRAIAYVPQDEKMFYGTIKQNLLLANPFATQAEIKQAAVVANVHDDIMNLKDNYDTRLGDQREMNFSPSFRQKLILARAYLQTAKFLILDDPHPWSNYREQQKFIYTLRQIKRNCTVLLITGKPALLEAADYIMYLKDMHIAYQGPPEAILSDIFKEYAINN